DGAARLLTMRGFRATCDDLILRSGRLAASRRMRQPLSYGPSCHCERSEAIQNVSQADSLDCFVARAPGNDVANRNDTPPHSRGANGVRIFTTVSLETEGAGNAGCLAAPAASRAKQKSTRDSHHRSAATSRHSLREWF